MYNWAVNHWEEIVEIFGMISGLVYIFLEIKAKLLMWPVGIVTSAFFIIVFFTSKFYADMSLQIYYLVISIYGWIYWYKGNKNSQTKKLPVTKISKKTALILLAITFILFLIMSFVLKQYTDSPIPYWDSFTTALSITATWMLAKKIIEQWLIWIIVDLVSMALYIYKHLYPTAFLFLVFTILAFVGYFEWKKQINKNQVVNKT